MKKKLAVMILVASMAASLLAACGAGADEKTNDVQAGEETAEEAVKEEAEPAGEAESEPAGEELTVAGVVFQDDEFMNALINGMKKACEENNVEFVSSNSNNDQSREVELINTYAGQGVDAICIAPLDKEASLASLGAAAAQGVAIGSVNMEISDSDFLVGGYASDDYANGHQVGEYAAEWIAEKYDRPIKVGLIHYDHQLPEQSSNRYGGFFAALDEAGIEYEIVANQGAEKEDLALSAASDMITAHPDIDVFYGANGGGLQGLVQAVAQSGKAGEMYAFGYDAQEGICQQLLDENDILQAIVVQDPYSQGYSSATLLIQYLRGEIEAVGTTESTPGFLLTRDDPEAVKTYVEENYK